MDIDLEVGEEKGPRGSIRGPSIQRPTLERTSGEQVDLTAPPASGIFDFLERRQISRYANLCQICARALPIWTF
jgi:hypothetical protein